MTKSLDLPFLLDGDKITPLDKGHTMARKWLVERGKQKFFLKETNKTIQKEVYKEISLSTKALPKLVEQFIQDGKTFSLYEFRESLDFDKMNAQEVLCFANLAAEKLKALSKAKASLPKQDIKKTIKTCKEEIGFYFENRQDNLPLSKEEFLQLVDKFSTSFEKQKPVLLHGDVKPENIIFDNEVCFVDTDEMRYGPFVFNFEYSVQMFFDKREHYKTFLWQLVYNFYDGELPTEFENNLKFVCIKKFFNRAKMFICAKDRKGEQDFVEEFVPIFEFLKQ